MIIQEEKDTIGTDQIFPGELESQKFLRTIYDFPGDHTQEQIFLKIASPDAFV